MDVTVSAEDRTLVDLDEARIVAARDADEGTWDLAFQAFGVFTNSGPSGPGAGAAFGPVDDTAFQSDGVPPYPFLVPDEIGGAFADWYLYDGHTLRSRYHVYAVKDGSTTWKVQILGYYGDDPANPVSALYQVRYAELATTSSSQTFVLSNVEGTGGPGDGTDAVPSECVNLRTGERKFLTAEAAMTDVTWHLCFRHESVRVNGGRSGNLGVTAVDLDAGSTRSETADVVRGRSPESELPRFDAVDYGAVQEPSLDFTGDGIVSAFSDRWIEADPPAVSPVPGVWLVQGSDGSATHLVRFDSFDDPTVEAPGTIRLRVKTVD